MQDKEFWMMAGTAEDRWYVYIKDVFQNIPKGATVSLLAFHALTGCDTTSFLCDHTKNSAWNVLIK